jgi:hypothetical protein
MWLAGVLALVCLALAAFSWAGVIGKPQDVPILLLLALVGVVLFIFMRFILLFID